jgi:PIN domain nuclease of toxin-antitoxin system
MVDQRGLRKLGIGFAHAALAGLLPRHHGDPFDRMLIAQAQSEGLTLVTRDRVFSAYGISLLKA